MLDQSVIVVVSGAGTNLKVGARFCLGITLFTGSTNTISRFCERFRDGQYSLVSFLLAVLLLTVPLMSSHL